MRLQNIYKSDIDRDISGVVKIAQNDEQSVAQELREYVVTQELSRHFARFLGQYKLPLTQPTDKIGLWISGFFGSGKSHFLKILSYLLSNQEVAGKRAVEYFSEKFADPQLFEELKACTIVPTETILFNIDSKSPLHKDKTAILRVFARVFYEHLGFCGSDLKAAKLEQFIEKNGRTKQFRSAFEQIHGRSWEESRESFALMEDHVSAAMTQALDMSETAARNWFNDRQELSIEELVREIREYIDSRGESFRLLFMIDEVGQYIGSDSDLMLELQTIVEEIGAKCGGRVWVMVTSQEDIGRLAEGFGGDLSKIQGRFNTRLSLSSSSVDEVIRRRLLAKTPEAEELLSQKFQQDQAVLRNLFSFKNASPEMRGFRDREEFVETYPFVPYQFRLMQNVLHQIRSHGSAGRHLSGGERSMLSGFQGAAQAIQQKDQQALVPFSLFYDTLSSSLESSVRGVIQRCQDLADRGEGLQQLDVSVLKLLFLVRFTEDVKPDLDTLTILMTDQIGADRIVLRRHIQQSLERLIARDLVSRAGDTYVFLTEEEQAISREIQGTSVDSAMIARAVAEVAFGKLFPEKKFKYGSNGFPLRQRVDELTFGQKNVLIGLRFITAASELSSQEEPEFLMRSAADNDVIIVLADSQPYFKELEEALKIRRFLKSRNSAQLPESVRSILRDFQQRASVHEKAAERLIYAAVSEGRVYAAGEKLSLKVTSVKERIQRALSALVEGVFTKLGCITLCCESTEELREILAGSRKFAGDEAIREVLQFLEIQQMKGCGTTMEELRRRFSGIPYGWRELDIAAVIGELAAEKRLSIRMDGQLLQPGDERLTDCLCQRSEAEKTIVAFRKALPTGLIRKCREFLSEFDGCSLGQIPDDPEQLADFISRRFEQERCQLLELISGEYAQGSYPGRAAAEEGVRLCEELLAQKNDALLEKTAQMEDDLLDLAEDMAEVRTFFRVQRSVFDGAQAQAEQFSGERCYFREEAEALAACDQIREILALPRPYRRIAELPELMRRISEAGDRLVAEKRAAVLAEIRAAAEEIGSALTDSEAAAAELEEKRLAAEKGSLTALDAILMQIRELRGRYLGSVAVDSRELCPPASLTTQQQIDEYVQQLSRELSEKLEENGRVWVI